MWDTHKPFLLTCVVFPPVAISASEGHTAHNPVFYAAAIMGSRSSTLTLTFLGQIEGQHGAGGEEGVYSDSRAGTRETDKLG